MISIPPPYAGPFTAAIMGFSEVCRREIDAKPCRDVADSSTSVKISDSCFSCHLKCHVWA